MGDLTDPSPVLEVVIGTIGLVVVMFFHGLGLRFINRRYSAVWVKVGAKTERRVDPMHVAHDEDVRERADDCHDSDVGEGAHERTRRTEDHADHQWRHDPRQIGEFRAASPGTWGPP